MSCRHIRSIIFTVAILAVASSSFAQTEYQQLREAFSQNRYG